MRSLAMLVALALAACAAAPAGEEEQGETDSALSSGDTFTAKGTGYYPSSSTMEGGFVDRKGAKLRTLQQYLAGKAEYVSVAMDTKAFGYGQHLRIQELEAKYGRTIDFRVVDTGGAFKGKGRTRIDVCTGSAKDSVESTINGRLTITTSATAPATKAPATADEPDAVEETEAPAVPSSGGEACASDGACNPGNDGSGLVCVSGRCVAGCRTNAQCPGRTTCSAGQCR